MELKPVTNWKQLGLQLSLQQSTLDEIELNNHDVANMKSSMLDQWLRKTPIAAWKNVVSALRNIDEERVAKDIEEKYCNGGKDDHASAPGGDYKFIIHSEIHI